MCVCRNCIPEVNVHEFNVMGLAHRGPLDHAGQDMVVTSEAHMNAAPASRIQEYISARPGAARSWHDVRRRHLHGRLRRLYGGGSRGDGGAVGTTPGGWGAAAQRQRGRAGDARAPGP